MVCGIQHDLLALTEAFCRPLATKRGKGQVFPCDRPCPRVEMQYTHLMALFALHCPAIIKPGEDPSEGVHFAHLRRFKGSQWLQTYIAEVRKLLCHYNEYILYRCFPSILVLDTVKNSVIWGTEDLRLGRAYLSDLSVSDHLTWCIGAEISVIGSRTSLAAWLASSNMTNSMLGTPILACHSWGA